MLRIRTVPGPSAERKTQLGGGRLGLERGAVFFHPDLVELPGEGGAALVLVGGGELEVVHDLEDARDFGGMNKVYATFFPKEPPARTTVESRLMIDIKIEIEAVAYAPVK